MIDPRTMWHRLRESMWFIPGIMLACALTLALGLIAFDNRIERDPLLEYSMLFGLGSDGSRGMLTAIASSMLTVAALAFTLTLNAVAQASSQYSPRVIRNYLGDQGNQFVFGYFVSVFAYCLVVLRTIRGGDEDRFIPSISVFTGLLLALGGVIVLIYFIHHIAVSLQVTNIVAEIVDDTRAAIDNIYPKDLGEPVENERPIEEVIDEIGDRDWIGVDAGSSGYIQSIDTDGLGDFARKHKLIMKVDVRIGDFVSQGANIADVTAEISNVQNSQIDRAIADEITDFVSINRHRTIEQDIGFGIRQLVDIALKALSPGVNDTTTAINAIDRLGELIGLLARREIPANVRTIDGKAYLLARSPDFEDHVEHAFDEVRISGRGNISVFFRLIDAISHAARATSSDSRRRALFHQIDLTSEYAEQTLETEYEKAKFEKHLKERLREIKDQR